MKSKMPRISRHWYVLRGYLIMMLCKVCSLNQLKGNKRFHSIMFPKPMYIAYFDCVYFYACGWIRSYSEKLWNKTLCDVALTSTYGHLLPSRPQLCLDFINASVIWAKICKRKLVLFDPTTWKCLAVPNVGNSNRLMISRSEYWHLIP